MIGIVITAYCVEPHLKEKLLLTENLCKSVSKLEIPFCLASHSPIPESIQVLCDGYVYDKDNSFHINGEPKTRRTHGLAELKSIHNAVNFLVEKFNITHFLKLTYDISAKTDFNTLLERCKTVNKEMISCQWNTREPSISTMCYYISVKFFKLLFSLNNLEYYRNLFESNIYKKCLVMGLLDKIQHEINYENFLGVRVKHSVHWAGKLIDKDFDK